MRVVGGVLTVAAGLALALYSVPFASWPALLFFILGVTVVVLGVRSGLTHKA